MSGWIVVFDLDDTLVWNVEGAPEVIETYSTKDTLSVLAKAIQKRDVQKTVQYIYLYTYNTNLDYILVAVDEIKNKLLSFYGISLPLHEGPPFDEYVFVKSVTEEPYPSKSAERIKELYDNKIGSPNPPEDIESFKQRIIFLDDLKHEVLFNDIGASNYAFLGKPDENPIQRTREITKIMKLLDTPKIGGKKSRNMTYKLHIHRNRSKKLIHSTR